MRVDEKHAKAVELWEQGPETERTRLNEKVAGVLEALNEGNVGASVDAPHAPGSQSVN